MDFLDRDRCQILLPVIYSNYSLHPLEYGIPFADMHRTPPTFSPASILACLAIVGWTCACQAPPKVVMPEVSLALVNGVLIDGTGADPLEGAGLLIYQDRIVGVGLQEDLTIPPSAQVIDLKGATMLPGLINAHVHAAFDADRLRAWAQAGVTTVRDLGGGGASQASLEKRLAFQKESLTHPEYARLVASTPMLTAPRGYGALELESPGDAQLTVDDLLDQGANLVKTSFEDDLIGRTWPVLSAEIQRGIVETAHARGVWVSAHVSRAVHVEQALDAGVDDLAHMVYDQLPDDLIQRVIEDGVYWVPTLELWTGVGWGAVPLENLSRFIQAGGSVALGTDYAGYTVPFDLGLPTHEMQAYEEAGMTPMDILLAATRNAAAVCNLSTDLGTLERGKLADILVVRGNPADDLQVLQDVQLVIKEGVIIRDQTGLNVAPNT
jgi:imidazolonepropionase-like amidohydrolase